MSDFFDVSTPAKRFRLVAWAEAVSWAGLLIAMGFKYIPDPGHPKAVSIPGMVHGVIFILFVLVSFVTARALKWSAGVTALALLASLPPFCTVLFEVWAQRTGRLAELSAATPEPARTDG
ncbi:MAG: DUF3817 domain-containing protein [Mycobacteriaceae bacterium]|nr:DUF3817 domain-containing protein [Mycobacteriaceae bacterium]